MAVPHFSVGLVTRGAGRSAVLSAAYRHCAKMRFDREGRTIDYTRKHGLLHEEFAIPFDAPEWLVNMVAGISVSAAAERFWNRVEDIEKRSDAQLAKDVTIALPRELSAQQNIALVRDFVERHFLAKGMIADWVYHDAPGNPHVHLMSTLRPLAIDGFGQKKIAVIDINGRPCRNDSGKIIYENWAGGIEAFNTLRDGWFACQNQHLASAGIDLQVDGQSFEKRGIDLTPTIHLGAGANAIERKGKAAGRKLWLERRQLHEERRAINAGRIELKPNVVIDLISREKSVFDERDIARIIHRYVDDEPRFQSLMAKVLQSSEVLRLDRERIDIETGKRAPAKYTTRALIRLEAKMVSGAIRLSRQVSNVPTAALLEKILKQHPALSEEQTAAIRTVTGDHRIAAVIGRAGAGKTTMMKAARQAWEAAGYRVVGGALAGKASEGLEKEAGICARTLSSWEYRWAGRRDELDGKTVFVLDEAGMVSSRQMALVIEAVVKCRAKLVLIGDPDQLQPIEAGAAFRAIVERIGYAELGTIYRQRQAWMRTASLDLARGEIGEAINAYKAKGRILGSKFKSTAMIELISAWDRDYDSGKSALILAHLRRDVRELNEMARATLVSRGIIDQGETFETAQGSRRFSTGDQIVFLRNEASLGVKNGMLAKVVEATKGRVVCEILASDRGHVTIDQFRYNDVDHGYATTIHKSQGATVDMVKVLASLSLDRHLTYVAMTRHREDFSLFFGERSFEKAGGLVQTLSRRNAKQTTLDYEDRGFYHHALRFAEARGLDLLSVARTLIRERLEWVVRQKQSLAELGARLARAATRLATTDPRVSLQGIAETEVKPLIAGIRTFSLSLEQAVEDRMGADPRLKGQWEQVSSRLHTVYAQPEVAFRAIDIDAMLTDPSSAATAIAAVAESPETFGLLKGRSGGFAGRADRLDRERALAAAPALARAIGRYLDSRAILHGKHEADERLDRQRASISITKLSEVAQRLLSRVRNAIDSGDIAGALALASTDRALKAELDAFGERVSQRFGEQTFLPPSAKMPEGSVFYGLTSKLNGEQKSEIAAAWHDMRTVQQLAAARRSTDALELDQALRLSESKGVTLR
jgi:Ti-type conjugative transfer relaxase TraA